MSEHITHTAIVFRRQTTIDQAKPLMDIGVPELSMPYVPPGAKQ